MNDLLLTIKQVAERLNCSTKTVYRVINDGRIECVRITASSKCMRISEEALQSFINENSFNQKTGDKICLLKSVVKTGMSTSLLQDKDIENQLDELLNQKRPKSKVA